MIYEILIGLLAIVGLLAGAEIVINRSLRIAKKMELSGFFIGLTVFSIGTSLPEIAVHFISSVNILSGTGDLDVLSGLVVGMNIGSNIAQITLITGIVTLFGVLRATKGFLKIDYMAMIGAILAVFIFGLDGMINRIEGVILFVSYGGYLYYLASHNKIAAKIHKRMKSDDWMTFVENILMLMGGLIVLLLSADQIAELTELFATSYQISGSLLGTTLVGLTTSLPELTTAISALKKKNSGMSLGTLVGSNITNPLLAIGGGAMISTYAMDPVILWYDLIFYFVVSVLLMLLMWRSLKLNRFGGLFLIISYFLFIIGRLYF